MQYTISLSTITYETNTGKTQYLIHVCCFSLWQVLNLFLALLLNAFGSESLKGGDTDAEDDKLALAFAKIKNLCCCCCSKFRKKTARTASVGPDEMDEEKQIGMTDLEDGNELLLNLSWKVERKLIAFLFSLKYVFCHWTDKQAKDKPVANGTVKANGVKHVRKITQSFIFWWQSIGVRIDVYGK